VETVIKLKGNGVENSSATNTGTSVEVTADSRAIEMKFVGCDVLTLNPSELEAFKESLVDKSRMDLYIWSTTSNRVVFDTSNMNYWISEYSPILSWSSENIGGFRAFSVFHDKWMANWQIENRK
jgi:hypothetical protein